MKEMEKAITRPFSALWTGGPTPPLKPAEGAGMESRDAFHSGPSISIAFRTVHGNGPTLQELLLKLHKSQKLHWGEEE